MYKKEEYYFYRAIRDMYCLCDPENCAPSDRTFDIKFNDFINNEKLLDVFNLIHHSNIEEALVYIGGKSEQTSKLRKNPTLRLLVQDKGLLIQTLKVLKPNDIRIAVSDFNI